MIYSIEELKQMSKYDLITRVLILTEVSDKLRRRVKELEERKKNHSITDFATKSTDSSKGESE